MPSSDTIHITRYNTLIRPVVTYPSETWLLKENMRIFGRRVTRKIFGPPRTDEGYWRIKTNQEINEAQHSTAQAHVTKHS